MKFVKRMLMVAGAVALAGLMGVMIAPGQLMASSQRWCRW